MDRWPKIGGDQLSMIAEEGKDGLLAEVVRDLVKMMFVSLSPSIGDDRQIYMKLSPNSRWPPGARLLSSRRI